MSEARARVLEVTSYPPPRAGWGIRVEFLKKQLEADGHECVVVNIGTSRTIPSDEYETVMGGFDFIRKVYRYSRRGFTVHAHANGDALKGVVLALVAEAISLLCGRRPVLTFHAGTIQRFFPRNRAAHFTPLFQLLFAMPARIICNSDAVKACIATYGVSPDKIIPIPAFSRQYMQFTPAPLPVPLDTFLQRYQRIVFTYLRMRPLFFPVTLVDGMANVLSRDPDVGLVICGLAGHSDEGVRPAFDQAIERRSIRERLCLLDDLDHDTFLTVLRRAAVYLRTPITDGVASSVLEALALGVPVVASDNGNRPEGVVTYPATDADALGRAVLTVLHRGGKPPGPHRLVDVPDTVAEEAAVLVS